MHANIFYNSKMERGHVVYTMELVLHDFAESFLEKFGLLFALEYTPFKEHLNKIFQRKLLEGSLAKTRSWWGPGYLPTHYKGKLYVDWFIVKEFLEFINN